MHCGYLGLTACLNEIMNRTSDHKEIIAFCLFPDRRKVVYSVETFMLPYIS